MPKIRRARSLSLERSRTSPYPVGPNFCESCKNVNSLESAQNVKEWEQARCPICIEHPHNAVLLKCSSHERGCRPFMCNSSYRHSNCFEQFCKLYGPIPLITELQEISFTSVASHRQMDECPGLGGNQLASELICPLCRGSIYGYMVVEPARQYMNSKLRSCSSETCDFSGTYSELRKHARSEHPHVRPSEVDPVRRHDWVRSQGESDLEDIFSLVQSDSAVDRDEDLTVTRTFRFWMSSFVTEMYGSLMNLISDSMLDSWSELETLQSRMDNMRRDLRSNVSTNSNVPTEVIYNLSIQTRPYSQPTPPLDFRSSQHMPRATQLHGQNQQQRVVESTSQSMPRATQLHGRNQQQRAVESTSQNMPRATQLHGQNQQQRAMESTSHSRSSQNMSRATQLHGQNQQQRAVESTTQSRQLRWRSQTSFGRHQRSFESASHAPERHRQHGSMYKSPPRASRLRWRNQRGSSSSSSSSNHNER